MVVTVRFHDHTRLLGLPALLARPVRRRIQSLNEIYDEVHELYGALQLDLSEDPAINSRDLCASDRLHPSELGHRRLAHLVGQLIVDEGLEFGLPSLSSTSERPGLRETARTIVVDVAPWIGRGVRDLAACAAHQALSRARGVLRPAAA